jgi:hypothetical protein
MAMTLRISRWLVWTLLVFLTGCATQEYRRVQAECVPAAQQDYPPDLVHGMVTRQRMVPIFMGRTCSVSPGGGTICHDLVQQQWVPYQESVVIDRNEAVRLSAIESCAKNLCLQRYGNAQCKTDVRLVPVAPTIETIPQPSLMPAPAAVQ